MEIDKKLLDEIKCYCRMNNLKLGAFVNDLLRKAFNEEKFGKGPMLNKNNNFSRIIRYNMEEQPMTVMETLEKELKEEEEKANKIKEEKLCEIYEDLEKRDTLTRQNIAKQWETLLNTNDIEKKEVKRRKLN